MSLREVIEKMRSRFSGFNPPASESDLSILREFSPGLSEDVLSLYRDHNGSQALPRGDGAELVARLIPIQEIVKDGELLRRATATTPKSGNVTWVYTDDNSNYCGVYTDGPLQGWITRLDHEEPTLTPAYRSLSDFLSYLIAEPFADDDNSVTACDIPSMRRQIPVATSDDEHLVKDRELATVFTQLYRSTPNEDQRRLHAFCAICLTPFSDTANLLNFLEDEDMWIPEEAVNLLSLRRYSSGIEKVEQLAREGHANGDGAAMRHLVSLGTAESQAAITRLKRTLNKQKRRHLEDEIRREKLFPRLGT